MPRTIIWFSCGASSALATVLTLRENQEAIPVYIDTGGEHEDNYRFLKDMEVLIGKTDNNIEKQDCIDFLLKHKIGLPVMYQLGFRNNNCIGCVKGGKGYWNNIRKHFPEHFSKMAKLEKDIGNTCIKGVYLDDLKKEDGRQEDGYDLSCDFVCQSQDI